jgi:phage tail tube protein FII
MYPFAIGNFNIYGPSGLEIGAAEITLSDLEWIELTLEGSGLAGQASLPIQGNAKSVGCSITWQTICPGALDVFKPGMIQLICKSDVIFIDNAAGEENNQQEEVIMSVWSKGINQGRRQASSKGEVTTNFAVTYLAAYLDGDLSFRWDFFNNQAQIGTFDVLAASRANT